MTGSVDDRTPAQVPVHEVVAVDPANCFVFVFLSLAFAVSCGRESRKDGGYIRLTLHVQRDPHSSARSSFARGISYPVVCLLFKKHSSQWTPSSPSPRPSRPSSPICRTTRRAIALLTALRDAQSHESRPSTIFDFLVSLAPPTHLAAQLTDMSASSALQITTSL